MVEGELCGGVGKFEDWERGVGVGRENLMLMFILTLCFMENPC